MKKLQSLLRKPFRFLLLLLLLLEFLPVFGKGASALRLYESHNIRGDCTTYYVLQPDGDLISWGTGPLDHDGAKKYRNVYPYLLRQKIARNVLLLALALCWLRQQRRKHAGKPQP